MKRQQRRTRFRPQGEGLESRIVLSDNVGVNLDFNSVYDHEPIRIRHQPPERIERPDRERIDEHEPRGRRDLNQAQMWMVGVFANELGVEANDGRGGEVGAALQQVVGVRDNLFLKLLHA